MRSPLMIAIIMLKGFLCLMPLVYMSWELTEDVCVVPQISWEHKLYFEIKRYEGKGGGMTFNKGPDGPELYQIGCGYVICTLTIQQLERFVVYVACAEKITLTYICFS